MLLFKLASDSASTTYKSVLTCRNKTGSIELAIALTRLL